MLSSVRAFFIVTLLFSIGVVLSLTLRFHSPHPHSVVLIPYRNRTYHLEVFVPFMKTYFETHFPYHTFYIWVIEQENDLLFNRGWLANVGLTEVLKRRPHVTCVIFHDIDLIPLSPSTPYDTCTYPIQLSSSIETFNWDVPYPHYAGGIVSMSPTHWQQINGFSNDYEGWGGGGRRPL